MRLKDYREIPEGEPTDREIIALLVDEILDLRTEVREEADRMVADALDQLGFTESAKAYKKMCERFYYS